MTYPPFKHVRARTPPPPVNQILSRHDVIWLRMLLFIAITNAGCGFSLCTLSKNSDDIYYRACLGRTPLEHVRARTPSPYQASLCMYPPYYLSIKMLLYIAITHAEKLSRIFNLSTSSRM